MTASKMGISLMTIKYVIINRGWYGMFTLGKKEKVIKMNSIKMYLFLHFNK